MKKILILLLIFSFGFKDVFAQKIFFRNYTVMNGLCANTIWDIEQDSQGFMWFGTKYGLNRFDGHEFKCYQFDKNNPKSIGNNFIRKIFKYDDDTFWIGTDEGIYIFDLKTEIFTLFSPIGKKFINDIFKDSKQNIWIASKANGVYKYQPKQKHIYNYVNEAGRPGLSSNEISKIIEDAKGNIWIGTYGKGIDVLNPDAETVKNFHTNNRVNSISNNFVLSLFKDIDNNIWIGTMSGGLNFYNPQSQIFKLYSKNANSGISDNIIRDIYQI